MCCGYTWFLLLSFWLRWWLGFSVEVVMMMMMNGRSGRNPFTASQWQELELQALIFKYMASGHPIPSDLILPIRRSVLLDTAAGSSSPTTIFPHQPNTGVGWGCGFQMGYGRKVEDPEPGRCRRTDGKKWRCSKEAHPDSKYCERHMHRGKNRSRKPVETVVPLNSTTAASAASAGNQQQQQRESSPSGYVPSLYPTTHNHPAVFPHHFNLDYGFPISGANRDFRCFHGMREEAVDQYGGGAERDRDRDSSGSWSFTPLGMSLSEPKPPVSFLQQPLDDDCYLVKERSSHYNGGGGDRDQEQKKRRQGQHCFVLGDDFKLQTPTAKEEIEEEESQKPLRRFFDEWPLKNKESPSPSPSPPWIDLEDRSFSKTQLSISTPRSRFSP